HRRHRRLRLLEPEQTRLRVTVGGDAAERFRRELLPGAEQIVRTRILEARLRVLARGRAGDLGLGGRRDEGSIMRPSHGWTLSIGLLTNDIHMYMRSKHVAMDIRH